MKDTYWILQYKDGDFFVSRKETGLCINSYNINIAMAWKTKEDIQRYNKIVIVSDLYKPVKVSRTTTEIK